MKHISTRCSTVISLLFASLLATVAVAAPGSDDGNREGLRQSLYAVKNTDRDLLKEAALVSLGKYEGIRTKTGTVIDRSAPQCREEEGEEADNR